MKSASTRLQLRVLGQVSRASSSRMRTRAEVPPGARLRRRISSCRRGSAAACRPQGHPCPDPGARPRWRARCGRDRARSAPRAPQESEPLGRLGSHVAGKEGLSECDPEASPRRDSSNSPRATRSSCGMARLAFRPEKHSSSLRHRIDEITEEGRGVRTVRPRGVELHACIHQLCFMSCVRNIGRWQEQRGLTIARLRLAHWRYPMKRILPPYR